MPDMRQFEDDVIRWLLVHYALIDTRTRFMLLDIEEEIYTAREEHDAGVLAKAPSRRLTFRALKRFFPAFPVHLEFSSLRKEDRQRLVFPRPLLGFRKTRLGREFRELDDCRIPFALIYHWPYQKSVLALHNCLPPCTDSEGVHCCWRMNDGRVAVLQELTGLAATIDAQWSPEKWLQSAVDQKYLTPVVTYHS